MSTSKGTDSEKVAVQRQLKIKVGAAKRLLKEHDIYKKEAEDRQCKVDRIVAENGEEWEIRIAKRLSEESQRMIKDTGDRLEKTVQDLKTLIDSVKSRPEFTQDKELLDAEKELTEATAQVPDI
ncbi:tubulin binding cofactor A [Boletus edulis]|uniref:Tubulin-specific chaperone A n=1 Tax=Boletus edulis BED1 TaxID=1328754 RepID=A0AAD4GAV4_BOLED|nr:tubulin binding cofactor A [Boletus edulis]KAF8433545.1 tubulin binding cofactor A [Boletus edulis BED1]